MRSSTALFVMSAALATLALTSLQYARKQRQYFSAPTFVASGTVLSRGALWHTGMRGGVQTPWFCWVSYTFTAVDGAPRQNWRLWEPACGTSPGRAIPIQYVTANPDINRPGGSEPPSSGWLVLFAAGVAAVIGIIVRGSERSDGQDLGALLR